MSMNFHVPTMAELSAQGIKPDVLFWIGCAGSFDERARRVTKAFAKILHKGFLLLCLVQRRAVQVILPSVLEMSFSSRCKP